MSRKPSPPGDTGRRPFEPLTWDEFSGYDSQPLIDAANAAIVQDKAEHEKQISNMELIHENKQMGLRKERDRLANEVSLLYAQLADATAVAEDLRAKLVEAERVIEFYASTHAGNGTHACDVDVRYQIDNGEKARAYLAKRREGE